MSGDAARYGAADPSAQAPGARAALGPVGRDVHRQPPGVVDDRLEHRGAVVVVRRRRGRPAPVANDVGSGGRRGRSSSWSTSTWSSDVVVVRRTVVVGSVARSAAVVAVRRRRLEHAADGHRARRGAVARRRHRRRSRRRGTRGGGPSARPGAGSGSCRGAIVRDARPDRPAPGRAGGRARTCGPGLRRAVTWGQDTELKVLNAWSRAARSASVTIWAMDHRQCSEPSAGSGDERDDVGRRAAAVLPHLVLAGEHRVASSR